MRRIAHHTDQHLGHSVSDHLFKQIAIAVHRSRSSRNRLRCCQMQLHRTRLRLMRMALPFQNQRKTKAFGGLFRNFSRCTKPPLRHRNPMREQSHLGGLLVQSVAGALSPTRHHRSGQQQRLRNNRLCHTNISCVFNRCQCVLNSAQRHNTLRHQAFSNSLGHRLG